VKQYLWEHSVYSPGRVAWVLTQVSKDLLVVCELPSLLLPKAWLHLYLGLFIFAGRHGDFSPVEFAFHVVRHRSEEPVARRDLIGGDVWSVFGNLG